MGSGAHGIDAAPAVSTSFCLPWLPISPGGSLLRCCWPPVANVQQGDPMLEKYFSAPKTLRRLRGGISGPHIDAFADDLEREGYAPASAVRYIRAASHLGCFVQRKDGVLRDINLNMLDSFGRHLRRCRCPHFKRGEISYHAPFGVKLFHHHLVAFGTHRGVKESTLRQYARGATDLLRTLGEDV